MRLFCIAWVVGLAACGSVGAQDGQEGPEDAGPTQPIPTVEEPQEGPVPADGGPFPGKSDAEVSPDTGLVWTEPPGPLPDGAPSPDAEVSPDASPDAAWTSALRAASLAINSLSNTV